VATILAIDEWSRLWQHDRIKVERLHAAAGQ
jgi:hypothetical protein